MTALRRVPPSLDAVLRDVAFDHLWRSSSVLALVLDAQGVVIDANARAEALFDGPVVGRRGVDLVGVAGAAARSTLAHLGTRGGAVETVRLTFRDLGGATLVLGEADAGELARVERDLAAMHADLQNLTREVVRKNRALARLGELKSRFVGMAAHDLRKPTGVILGYVDLVLDGAGAALSDDQRRLLGAIRSSCSFMARVIDDFLDLAVIEAGQLTLHLAPSDPGSVVRAGARRAEEHARRADVTVSLDLEPGTARRLDASKIEQVAMNLVGNAIEHSPPGGRVVVASRLEGAAFTLTVSDEGPGIDPDDLARLFRPFERGAHGGVARVGSFGLGLSISKMIIDAHGGSLDAASGAHGGTVFVVRLPGAGERIA